MKDTTYFLHIYDNIVANIRKCRYIESYDYLFEKGIEYQFEHIVVEYFMCGRNPPDFSLLWIMYSEDSNIAFKEFISAVDALYSIDSFEIHKNQSLVLNSLRQAEAFQDAEYETDSKYARLSDFKKRFSSVSVCYTAY